MREVKQHVVGRTHATAIALTTTVERTGTVFGIQPFIYEFSLAGKTVMGLDPQTLFRRSPPLGAALCGEQLAMLAKKLSNLPRLVF
jgi:hypothetical protein